MGFWQEKSQMFHFEARTVIYFLALMA